MNPNIEKAFLVLLETYKAIIYKISHAYAITPEDRKDLFQEIVVSLWKAYPSFQEKSKLSTWIYRVALYTAITNYRRSKKQIRQQSLQPALYNLAPDDYNGVQQDETKLLYAAMERLSPVDKAIIILLLEEKSYTEISGVLGITVAAAGMRIKRAKDKLANILTTIKV